MFCLASWPPRIPNPTRLSRNDAIVNGTTTYGNVTIRTVDHVLGIPAPLAETVPFDNASLAGVQALLQTLSVPFFNTSTGASANASLFDVLDAGLRGFTLFAPESAVLAAAASSVPNASALLTLVENHVRPPPICSSISSLHCH